ncbi:MAG: hypothetical protein IKG89_01620 [Oscillospiraceae bacterium]|nr:hypothetical protein [Oscillospiraceae bacterium]
MTWDGRYLCRLQGRNLGKSVMSLLLAALLAFAFGVLTVLRGVYSELYRNVEVKADFSGGLSYTRAVKIADSGYVRDPYYEILVPEGQLEMSLETNVILTNRLDKRVSEPVEWLEGWDVETAMNTAEKVMVIYFSQATTLGIVLGDMVRFNETDWWLQVTSLGLDPLKPGETDIERRDARRPFFKVVGIIRSEFRNDTVYLPLEAHRSVLFLVPKAELDLAEYTLADYHQAAEFSAYAQKEIDRDANPVRFHMDTSYADRIFKIHQLIETLYPLTIAAALFLGGVLPGLTVLHASRQISVIRALGAKIGKCVGIYTLAQLLCALFGLILGFLMVILTQHPDLSSVLKPFGIYLAAHLAACALGSGVFAWLCARKHVLAQLQAKE